MKHLLPFTALCFIFLNGCAHQAPPPPVFNVRCFGAAGDGETKDTAAIQSALDACADTDGEVLVPAGKYLIGSVVLGRRTHLHLCEGATLVGSSHVTDYPTTTIRWEGRWREGHRALLFAQDADYITITGPGHIVGNGPMGHLRNPRGPCLIEFIRCSDIRMENFSTQYERLWSIHPTDCRNVVAKNLTIRSTQANGDGIDVDSCLHVVIDHCDIDTGDDAIALKSGRGMEAFQLARPTQDVSITNCTLGSSIFGALAIGTEMSGSVRDVRVSYCTFTRGQNAIYIKSRIGRGGTIEDIYIHDIIATNPKCFCRFDLIERGIQDEQPVPGPLGVPRVHNINIENATTTCPTFVDAEWIPEEQPVDCVHFSNITGTAKSGMHLANMTDASVRNITVHVTDGPTLATHNVTGTGLENAEDFTPRPPHATTRPARTASSSAQ
jgi:polygalacturonase